MGGGILSGYFIGRWIDPDLDQVSISSSEGRLINELKFFGTILVGYTTIYGSIFRKNHRSFFTHFPGISTIIRLVYLFWWVWFLPVVTYDWEIIGMIGVWFGLSIADLEHYLADLWFSKNSKD